MLFDFIISGKKDSFGRVLLGCSFFLTLWPGCKESSLD